MSRRFLGRGGFTLIELLVTVAIIGILATLILAGVSKAKARAHSIACLGNLRQLTMGFKMAIDSDEGKLNQGWWNGPNPPANWPDRWAGTAQGQWWGQNWGQPAKGSICPAAPERHPKDRIPSPYGFSGVWYPGAYNAAWVVTNHYAANWWWWGGGPPSGRPEKRSGSYAPNGWLAGSGWWWNDVVNTPWRNRAFLNDGDIRNASSTPVFGDGIHWPHGGYWWGPSAEERPASNLAAGGFPGPPFGMAGFTIPRHGSRPSVVSTNHPASRKLPGAINLGFYDGHAETVKLEGLWQLTWHKDYRVLPKRPGL
jgi:prepilin-type N-terminal cleavage/methylation domain-containing protein/prepilin-type processing-associated H-X9-DG protein